MPLKTHNVQNRPLLHQKGYPPPTMAVQRKRLSLLLCLSLMATLWPGASCKRGLGFRGRGKDDGSKPPPSQGRGLAKQGLKLAGAAAAAGALGGTGTGLGLGLLGKPRRGSKDHHYNKAASSEESRQRLYNDSRGSPDRSLWRGFVKSAAHAPTNGYITSGHVLSVIIASHIMIN